MKDLHVEQSEKVKFGSNSIHGSVYMLDGSEAMEVYPSTTAMQAIWTKEMHAANAKKRRMCVSVYFIFLPSFLCSSLSLSLFQTLFTLKDSDEH